MDDVRIKLTMLIKTRTLKKVWRNFNQINAGAILAQIGLAAVQT